MREVVIVIMRVQTLRAWTKAGARKMKRRRCIQQIMRRMKNQVEAEDKGERRVKDNLQICSLEAKKSAVIFSDDTKGGSDL